MTQRYLTPEAKSIELADWEKTKREARRTDESPGLQGGMGGLDSPIVPYCDRLNSLPGVVTLQSCAGHLHDTTHHTAGQLWLWLSQPLAGLVYENILQFYKLPRVERMRILWVDGREILDVIFDGLNRYSDLQVVEDATSMLQMLSNSVDPWSTTSHARSFTTV